MKRKFYKVTAFILSAVMFLTACGKGMSGEETEVTEDYDNYEEEENVNMGPLDTSEGKYPITWNLSEIYNSPDEWNADYDKVMEMLKQYDGFKGQLNNARNIDKFLSYAYLTEMTTIQSRLYTYAHLGSNLDPTDPVFKEMKTKLDSMNAEEGRLQSFAEPEIYSLSLEEREKIFSDPIFKGKEYWLKNYTDPDYEPMSEEELNLLATMSPGQGYSNTIFDILENVELPNPRITMPGGMEEELTEDLYQYIVSSHEFPNEFKIQASETMLTRYKPFANTFATLLEENCQQAFASAQIDGYASTRESAMDDYDLDPEVYDMLVEAAHEGLDDYQRFLDIHKEALGLDVQYSFQIGATLSDYFPGLVKYDDAVDEVVEALDVLGDDYKKTFMDIVTGGHVDVYPTKTKFTGAFEVQPTDEYLPWVLFNYSGYPDDVSTIAHEMGHAVYSQMSVDNQERQYSTPTTFTQEVASTTNEILYYSYKIKNAGDDQEKLFYLEGLISMFVTTFFTQMMYAEFEDYMYKQVEAGSALNPEDLGDKWMELLETYRGDSVKTFDDARYQWAAIPHFYYVYYVYMYAADVAYAASIAERINSNEQGAVDDYLSFLKLGGSAAPVDLLSVAGIDPLSEDTYIYALDYFGSLVDEYERLALKK